MTNGRTIDRHVLMLDDEEIFLRFGAIPFRTGFCGFCTWHLHGFTDPDAALEHYAENADRIDVVLTDQNMPKLTGVEFIDRIRSLPSGRTEPVPVIIVSSDAPPASALPHGVTVVAKPYTKDDIARGLCDVSVVCETGKCGHVKPRPLTESMVADRYDTLPVYG